MMPYQTPASNPGRPDSTSVGTSGANVVRFRLAIAIARRRPARTCGSAGGVVFIITSTSPAIRLMVAGAMPLNGMCTMSVAVTDLNNSMPKCEVVPLPPVE